MTGGGNTYVQCFPCIFKFKKNEIQDSQFRLIAPATGGKIDERLAN
jgi:hypothetical protein